MAGSTKGEEARPGEAEDRARADREATDWLIRLQDDPGDAGLRASFRAWLDADAVNAAAWAETERVSQAIAALPMRSAGANRMPVRRSAHATAFRAGRSRIWKVSAIAAAACVAVVAAPELLLRARADAFTGTGEVRTIRLADGSTARLAPDSALAVRIANGQRQVQLLRGSAYFDVAHDARHPFRIAAGGTTTTVLGTAFEVRRQDAGVAVAVRRGLVRVSCDRGPQSELLAVGQSVDLACDRPARRGTVEPARVATWTSGQLVVTDRTMREVVDAIRPWYGGYIVARGAGMDHGRVTGVYDLRDPRAALDALAAAHHAQVRRITPWLTMISAD